MAKFKVIREHQGDRFYKQGEIREGSEADFKHLIPHVLQPDEGKEKAEAAPKNKAEDAAPANKASRGRKADPKQADEADKGEY